MTKELARQLQRDFVPGGERVDVAALTFRRLREYEIFQCCFQTGSDWPQSGPIYCGDVAEYITDVPGGTVAACERHAKRASLKIAEAA